MLEVPHAGPHLTSLAYRFETKDGVYVHPGDTGVTDAFTTFCTGADVLVHMCHYYTGSGFYSENNPGVAGHMEVARTAASAGVKTCVLTHITESIDVAGIREQIVREMAQVFSGNIIFGEDLMPISLAKPEVLGLM